MALEGWGARIGVYATKVHTALCVVKNDSSLSSYLNYHILRITQAMVQAGARADIDAINYATMYTTEIKATFSY